MKLLFLAIIGFTGLQAAPVALFDGKSLAGWESPAGEEKWWQVRDQMIVGGSLEEQIPENLFLSSVREYRNFNLKFKIRLVEGKGFMNSGVQIRSSRLTGESAMTGYQVDAGIGYWGDLYDEHRREQKLIGSRDPAALAKVVKDWEWNEYLVLCEGRRIRSWINGQLTFDYTERDSAIPLDGKLGIQVHAGGALLVQLKDLQIEELPETPGAASWRPDPPSRPAPAVEKSTARTPEAERQSFHLPEGFIAELVSSEEQGVGKPITMTWDGLGRMWTMTALEYPVDANENRANAEALYARGGKDQVLIFDHPEAPGPQRPRIFAEGLALPLGLLPDLDGNGALVHYGSQIRHYLDTNHDGKSDKFDVVLEGFGIQDSHLMPHQFERAPGGWIYVAQGLFNASKVCRPGSIPFADGSKDKVYDACKLGRFRPDGSCFEVVSAGPNNIWGFYQNRQGETYLQEANDMGIPIAEFESGTHYETNSRDKLRSYAPTIPQSLSTGLGGTGLSGLASAEDHHSQFATIYGGDQVVYVANPITNRIQVITTQTATNQHPEYFKREDFLVADDPWFRPVSVQFGPDGFLYIADWYNKIISHNEVPRTHPDRDKTRGRIWRIRPVNTPTPARIDLTRLSDDAALAMLGGSSARTAAMTWSWLGGKMTPSLATKLRKITMDSNANVARRLDAFRALEAGKSIDSTVFTALATDSSAAIRYQAIRAAGELQMEPESFAKTFAQSANDPSYRVRAGLANAVRNHLTVTVPMIAMVARLGRAPVTSGVEWEKYDRDFERYIARWAMEIHREETAELLHSTSGLSQENRLLAILALEPIAAAAQLVTELPTLQRALTSEELTLLSEQLSQPIVLAALQSLLTQEATRKSTLRSLMALDTRLLANPSLAAAVASACEMLITATPITAADRTLVLKLTRLFRLRTLEPSIASRIKESVVASELAEVLSTLREIGSNRIELFTKFLDHPDDAVRREAIAAIASSSEIKSVELLVTRWDRLPGALRAIALDGMTSSKDKAAVLTEAATSGRFTGLDAAVLEKLLAVLGENDPALVKLIAKTNSLVGRVIRLPGVKGAVIDSPITLAGPFTIETWIKLDPDIGNNDGILGKVHGEGLNFHGKHLHFYGGVDQGDLIISTRPIQAEVWTHCAITRDTEGNLKLYFDGELDPAIGKPSQQVLKALRPGQTSTGQPGAARYDEFRVWEVARSADEIRQNFQARLTEQPLHLVKRLSGDQPGSLIAPAMTELTLDFPPFVSAAQSAAAAQRFERFRAMIASPGDPLAGRVQFQATCMICHQVKGEGMKIGPDLSGVGAMGVEAILRNVLDPNAQLESGYYRHDIALLDGSLVSGFLLEEKAESITIRPIGADPKVIARSNISKHTISKRSIMPEGLIEGFKEKQVADLFSYLKSLK